MRAIIRVAWIVTLLSGCWSSRTVGAGSADVDSDFDTDTETNGDVDTETSTSDTETESDIDTMDVSISCGWGWCYSPQICCVTTTTPFQECVDPGECSGFAVTCDGPEDCPPGNNCCLPTGALMTTSCTAGVSGDIICKTEEDCPTGQLCCANTFLGWVHNICSNEVPCP